MHNNFILVHSHTRETSSCLTTSVELTKVKYTSNTLLLH